MISVSWSKLQEISFNLTVFNVNHSKADESDEGYDADLYYVSKSEDTNA